MASGRTLGRDVVAVAVGLSVLGAGLRLVSALAGALAPSLGAGWSAVVGLVVAAPAVALAWTLVVDGPWAVLALVRPGRGRR